MFTYTPPAPNASEKRFREGDIDAMMDSIALQHGGVAKKRGRPRLSPSPFMETISRRQAERFVMEAIDTMVERERPCVITWTGSGLKVSRLSTNDDGADRALRNKNCLGVFDIGVEFRHLIDELGSIVPITE